MARELFTWEAHVLIGRGSHIKGERGTRYYRVVWLSPRDFRHISITRDHAAEGGDFQGGTDSAFSLILLSKHQHRRRATVSGQAANITYARRINLARAR